MGRADHRKLYVIDGAVAWTGGAGIEDHFRERRLPRHHGSGDRRRRPAGAGGVPDQLSRARRPAREPIFPRTSPRPRHEGSTPIALAQVIPGGHVAASQALREQIDGARRRLDVMNPYVTDADMIGRILAAARRGVAVRLVVSQTSNNSQATAALKHYYGDLAEAGVELWELPGTVVHAKVVVADDVVSFGTVNLDAWALYRNNEIMMLARSAETAKLIEERLFEPDIARSQRGVPPEGAASGSRAGSGADWGRFCSDDVRPDRAGGRELRQPSLLVSEGSGRPEASCSACSSSERTAATTGSSVPSAPTRSSSARSCSIRSTACRRSCSSSRPTRSVCGSARAQNVGGPNRRPGRLAFRALALATAELEVTTRALPRLVPPLHRGGAAKAAFGGRFGHRGRVVASPDAHVPGRSSSRGRTAPRPP